MKDRGEAAMTDLDALARRIVAAVTCIGGRRDCDTINERAEAKWRAGVCAAPAATHLARTEFVADLLRAFEAEIRATCTGCKRCGVMQAAEKIDQQETP